MTSIEGSFYAPALEALSSTVTALVGRSGAGKSTLVNLILRFYDPLEGEIYIDNFNIKEFKIKSLRKLIGVVPQEPFLFSGTIGENILYGKRDATFDEIEKAVRFANADEFIKDLPDGYDTLVGERGVGLSVGQKQRIGIARAIIKDPSVLVLDEATSAVDSKSEALIRDAIYRVSEKRTSIIIAHRLSTVIAADKILVLDEGKVVEQGNHKYLYNKNGLYRKLYDKQFSQENNNTDLLV